MTRSPRVSIRNAACPYQVIRMVGWPGGWGDSGPFLPVPRRRDLILTDPEKNVVFRILWGRPYPASQGHSIAGCRHAARVRPGFAHHAPALAAGQRVRVL